MTGSRHWKTTHSSPGRVTDSPTGVVGRFGVGSGLRWGIGAAAVALGELAYLRWYLPRNHPADHPGSLYPTVGAANLLTLGRGGAFAALAGFALVDPAAKMAWLPAVCYASGVVLDNLDGRVARHRDRTTVLGAKLDQGFDTLGFLLAPVVGALWGRLPVWYLSLGAARYAFKLACWARRRRGLAVDPLRPSRRRRLLAGFQMCFLAVALTPVVPAGPVRPAAAVVLLPSLAGFLWDYLAVTRRLP